MTPEQLLDLQMAEPEPNGSVVKLRVSFEGTPTSYTYATVKVGGMWYVTGRHGTEGRTWSDLINLISGDGGQVNTAQLATTLEDLL